MIQYKKEPITGFEEYQVDTNGVVYNKNGSVKKYSLNPKGYPTVTFSINGKLKSFAIHTLVAKQFIPNPDNLPQVNHKDGNRANNNVDNLEWCTAQYNTRHSFEVLHRKIYGKKPIIGIDKYTNEVAYKFNSLADAGRYFGELYNVKYRYCQNSIYKALKGILETYKGCYWRYVE